MRIALVLAAAAALSSALHAQCTTSYDRTMLEIAPALVGRTASYAMTYPTAPGTSAVGNFYILLGCSPPYTSTTYAAIPGFNTFGCWRVDLATASVITSGVLDSTGMTPIWDYAVPNNPALIGTGFDIQGVDMDSASTPNLYIADNDVGVIVASREVPAIARWRTATGIRRTSSSDTLAVIVEAHTSVNSTSNLGEGGVARVDFSVVVNGGSPTVTQVTTPALHTPNHSDQASPLPGATGMARVWGYGITLNCSTLAQGTIVVTANVVSGAGTVTPLPGQITLFNDKGGADSRPCAQTIYVEPPSPNGAGNDSNSGLSTSAPLATLQAAMLKAAALTTGATGDVGGAHIVMLPTPSGFPSAPNPGRHAWAGGQYGIGTPLHTSSDWWVTVEVQAGAYLERVGTIGCSGGVPLSEPNHYLVVPGNGSGSMFRIRFVLEDPTIRQVRGGLVIGPSTGVGVDAWIDGGRSGSAYRTSSTQYSVRFTEDEAPVISFGSDAPNRTRRVTCHTREGVSFGFAGWSDIQDVVIKDVTGIALQSALPEPRQSACNVLISGQRYHHEVAGHVNSDVAGLVDVSIVSGRMRLTARPGVTIYQLIGSSTGAAVNIGERASELVGSPVWGVRCTGFSNAGNNDANAAFAVYQVDASATPPWIDLVNSSAVAEAPAGGTARIVTARLCQPFPPLPSPTYEEAVHPDIQQYNADLTDVLHSHVAVRDFADAQTWFTGGHMLRRIALFNVSDGGGGTLIGNMNGTCLTDCLFHNMTMTGLWNFTLSGNVRYAGTEFVNCVIGPLSSGSGQSNAFPPGAAFIDANHWIGTPGTGSATGSNNTSGTWLLSPQTIPFGLEPASPTPGNASLAQPAAWDWGGTVSRGVWRNVGLFDWN
jgi:hypothetical protein